MSDQVVLSMGINSYIDDTVRIKNPERIKIGNNVEIRSNVQLYSLHNTQKDKYPEMNSIELGNFVHLKENVNLSTYGGYIKIGDRSNIGQNCVLYGHGGIEIGSDVMIAPNCTIVSGSHNFEDLDKPMNRQGVTKRGIRIENDVWIGANVVVLDGVIIGEGSVIGAGSVVTKSIPSYKVAFGSPAKVIRNRENDTKCKPLHNDL